jgi:hypothetical protein
VSSNIYYQKPKYTVGHATVLAYMLVFVSPFPKDKVS